MMLGSVFNRYHASTDSESSKAPQARLRTFRIGRDSHPFSEFKGLGPPGSDVGLPGDIYIDLTPEDHALYARYPDSWRLWPGPKDVSTLLLHPKHSDRCLWCNEAFGWYHRKNIRVNPSGTASELLSEALKHRVTLSEESKKRKRDALGQAHQPTQTQAFSTTNASIASQNHARENQSPTDALSLSHSTTPTMSGYPQSTPEITIPSTHIPTTAPNMHNPEHCTGPPNTDSNQSSIPTEIDHVFPYKDLSERNRNLHERCTSPKRIDLREFAKRRKSTPSTHGVDARSVLYQRNDTQSCPQPGFISSLPYVTNKLSIQNSVLANNLDISSLDPSTAISTLIVGKTLANSPDLHISPTNESISPSLSRINRERLTTEGLRDPVSLASTNWELPYSEEPLTMESPSEKPTLETPIDNGLDTSIVDPSDTIPPYVREANDKIRRLEAENAQLRARLLRCQCNLSSHDTPMVTNMDMDSDSLNCALDDQGNNTNRFQKVGVSQSQRETVGNISSSPQLYPGCHPYKECEPSSEPRLSPTLPTSLSLADPQLDPSCHPYKKLESSSAPMLSPTPTNLSLADPQPHPSCHPYRELESSSAPRLSATPPTSLSLADTIVSETMSSAHAIPLLEPENMDSRDVIDIFQVESGIPSHDDCKTFESSVNSPSVKEKIAEANTRHASPFPVPTSMSLRMREIHRLVLFAKAGSSLICRICLGTKLGGIETVDQTFKTTESSPDLMQEHCEREHPKECEALMNMSDDELLELVSMLTPEG